MIDGTASRPYVTRALVPVLVHGVSAAMPESFRAFVDDHMRGRRIVRLLGWEDRFSEFAVATILFAGCFTGFAFAMRRLTLAMYDFPSGFRDLAPLIGLAALPLCFRYFSYPYDPATLLLFSLGVLFIIEDRVAAFVITLVLAAINKETSVLLVGLYALNRSISERAGVIVRAALLLLVWCAARGVIEVAYRGRPGGPFETHVDHTVWLFSTFPGRLWYALTVVALLAAAVVPGWRDKSLFLRRGLAFTVLPLFCAALWAGFADELRGYYEATPFVFLLALPSIYRWTSDEPSRPA